jgi:hypothetical protein
MMDIDADHFDDIHCEEMKPEMYVEIVIVHYHLKYHHLTFDHLDYDYYYYEFSFYSLILLFAIHRPMKQKKLEHQDSFSTVGFLPETLLLLFERSFFAYFDYIHERQGR